LKLTIRLLVSFSGGGDTKKRVGMLVWLARGVTRPVVNGADGLGLTLSTIRDPEKTTGMSSDA
jgi:hypothetical protein